MSKSRNHIHDAAWAVLDQLARGPVWDGDLISKEGRNELVDCAYAKRDRRDERGLAVNELTESGKRLAAQYHHQHPRPRTGA
jgi:hypothetical protein